MPQENKAQLHNCLAACVITDAERYTGLTETMEPQAIVEIVNRYFDTLFGPVLAHGGFVTDVKGDGVLAVWNYATAGPQLKARVARACLEMLSRIDELNQRYPAHRLPTRLGVDFGPVALAQVGARDRFEYRAVGDPVNTASRLQELNKALRTRIVVSDTFAQGVSGYLFRDLGAFQLRGKRSRTRVRELIGAVTDCSPRQHALAREFSHVMAALDAGATNEARRRLQTLQDLTPEDGPTRYYLQRLEAPAREAEYAQTRSWISELWGARS